ncbi:MAG: TrbI/VirB10 family protein [Negativicutes bacterium]|nr:TrbI/VirB10 family protein [Negativicutes bacterium]
MWPFTVLTNKINQFFPAIQAGGRSAAVIVGTGNKDGDRGFRKVGLKNTLLMFLLLALAAYLLTLFVSGMFSSKTTVKPADVQPSKAVTSQQTPASNLPDDYGGYPMKSTSAKAVQTGNAQGSKAATATVTPVTQPGQISVIDTGQYGGRQYSGVSPANAGNVPLQEKNQWLSSAIRFTLAKTEAAPDSEKIATVSASQSHAAAYQMAAPNTLLAGSVIPVSLITGINSDLSGDVVAQVRQDVYDSVTGQILLIPQGSRLLGAYEGKTKNGQNRIEVVFSRILFPDGHSVEIDSQKGTDKAGYPGLSDQVDNHSGRLIGAGVMTSLLAAAAQIAAGNTNSDNQTYGHMAVQGAATNVMEAGAKLLERDMQITPTITIRPGTQFTVFINKDLVIPAYGRKE